MDLTTFEDLMDKKLFPEMTQQDLYNAFKVFDKNNTGRINTQEFEQIMKQVNKQESILTGEEISKFLKLADPKEEGFFDYDFFIKTLN